MTLTTKIYCSRQYQSKNRTTVILLSLFNIMLKQATELLYVFYMHLVLACAITRLEQDASCTFIRFATLATSNF
jgi:hypothetical protein